MSDWVEARSVKGLFAESATAPPPPMPFRGASRPMPAPSRGALPPMPVPSRGATPPILDKPTAAPSSAPPLWNPRAANAWSLLFTWGFAAFLLARNWEAFGNEARAKRAMLWFYGLIPYVLLALLTPDTPLVTRAFWFVGAITFVAWSLLEARSQISYVKETYGSDYPRKPWLKPLAAVVGSYMLFLVGAVTVAVASSAFSESPDVLVVKQGRLAAHPGIDVGRVIDAFLDSPRWTAETTADGRRLVNVEGGMTYAGKPVKALLQFVIDGERFDLHAVEMNGVPQSDLLKIALVGKMYEVYANRSSR